MEEDALRLSKVDLCKTWYIYEVWYDNNVSRGTKQKSESKKYQKFFKKLLQFENWYDIMNIQGWETKNDLLFWWNLADTPDWGSGSWLKGSAGSSPAESIGN